jgi:hypothetical protein
VVGREGVRVGNGGSKVLFLLEGGTINRSRLIKDEHKVNHSVTLLGGTVPGGVFGEYRDRSSRTKIGEVDLFSTHELSSARKVAGINPDIAHSIGRRVRLGVASASSTSHCDSATTSTLTLSEEDWLRLIEGLSVTSTRAE